MREEVEKKAVSLVMVSLVVEVLPGVCPPDRRSVCPRESFFVF